MGVMNRSVKKVAVLGSGGWGTALAVHLGRLSKDIRLWGRDGTLVSEMLHRRENREYLPDVALPETVRPINSIEEALAEVECIVIAVPSHGVRALLRQAAPFSPRGVTVVSAAKGLEGGTLYRMSEIIQQELGQESTVAVLSGPSFAAEVARESLTAVSVAARDSSTVAIVQREFRSSYFRLYGSDDVIGVEVGGALKNVIAIAVGVADGLGLGRNATAALISRGLAEVSRLACALGGRRDTLSGLSGLGDMVLTCTGSLSRNRKVGFELGRGRQLREVLSEMKMVAEGVRTTDVALALGERCKVEMPIASQMGEVLSGRCAPRNAVQELMDRPQRSEDDS